MLVQRENGDDVTSERVYSHFSGTVDDTAQLLGHSAAKIRGGDYASRYIASAADDLELEALSFAALLGYPLFFRGSIII